MPIPAGYGELTRSVIIANPTDPELALDNHRSYFLGGPFFPAPIPGRWQEAPLPLPQAVTLAFVPRGNKDPTALTTPDGLLSP
ncbi:hypothetical protein PIB30_087611 [Stylosanthes scabra]|uniref:Uncharacterized protein n=1 Tax=Stylosanthes scabra TaxID=79078 RepID=A0ABU6RUC2_9FABA|nr:hypothetical protein [Stylosanthes scabra]